MLLVPLLLLQLFSDAFSRDSQLLVADPTQHTHLAAALMMRGRLSLSDAQRNIGRLRPQLRMAHWNTEVCVCVSVGRGVLCCSAAVGRVLPFCCVPGPFIRPSPCLAAVQGFKLGLCAHPPVGLPYSMLCLSNNCCIGQMFETLLGRFHKLFKRKCVSFV